MGPALFGYVRHFHPSDEAFRADWSALAISGVPAVEAAENAAQLGRRLEDFFRSVAPTVRVFPAAQAPPQLELGGGTRTISWRHHGFGTGNPQSAYRSERIRVDVTGGKLPAPFLADLGGGVKAFIPMALYVDEKGTLPHAAATPARPKNVSARYTGNDRATRLGDVVMAWNIFQHFYPYFDVVRTDWPKALTTALQSAAADKDEKEFLITLRRLLAALKDGHGGVYVQGQALMAPPVVFGWVQNQLVVTQVGEAAGQPIERGDAVLSIDGKPTAQALAETEALISGATPQWIRYRAVSELGARPPDQPLMLEIEPFRDPWRRRTVTLQSKPVSPMPVEPRPEKITELKPGIFYVDLSRIAEEDWKAALAKLESATGIVFDLRGYPRVSPQWLTHLSEKPLDSAQWHIPVISEPDRKNMKFDRAPGWNLPPSKPYLRAKKVVLTDGRAIIDAAGRIQRHLDRNEGSEARRLGTPRGGHPADHPGRANPRRGGGGPR